MELRDASSAERSLFCTSGCRLIGPMLMAIFSLFAFCMTKMECQLVALLDHALFLLNALAWLVKRCSGRRMLWNATILYLCFMDLRARFLGLLGKPRRRGIAAWTGLI